MTIGAFRAYFTLNDGLIAGDPASGVNNFVLNFGDDTNGIEDIESSISQSEVWYTLSGMKLSGKPNAKGVYINNGRKVVIK